MANRAKTSQEINESDDSSSHICFCCWCCGVNPSTATRIRYTLILLVTFVICVVALLPNMREKLDKTLPFCKTHLGAQICNNIAGYSAVYRLSFAIGLYFFLLSLLLMGVRFVDDQRAQVHNGYWFVKLLLFTGFTVGSVFIPSLNGNFDRVWMYVGLAGSFLFILIQLALLIDVSHSWNETWAANTETSSKGNGATCWYVLLLLCAAVLYGVSLTAVACFYLLFTAKKGDCFSNTFFISFILCHCAVVSFISVIPRVQQAQPSTGLLQAAVVTTYTMYMTWTALSHEPDDVCNPKGYLISGYNEANGLTLQSMITGIMGFAMLIYAGFRPGTCTSRWSKWFSCFGSENSTDKERSSQDTDKTLSNHKKSDYNYSFFHFVMFLASLYLMMALTNWYDPYQGPKGTRLTRSWPAVWVKMGSSSACLWLYTCTLLVPVLRSLFSKYADELRDETEPLEFKQRHSHYKDDIEKFSSPKAFSSPKVSSEMKPETNRKNAGEEVEFGEINKNSKHYKTHRTSLQENRPAEVTNFHSTVESSVTLDNRTKHQPLSEADKEMFRLQEKVLKIQSKIAKLQNKVAVLQGLNI